MCSPVECILTGRSISRNWLPSVFSYSRDDKKPVGVCLTNVNQHSACPDQNRDKNRLDNGPARFYRADVHARKTHEKTGFCVAASRFSFQKNRAACGTKCFFSATSKSSNGRVFRNFRVPRKYFFDFFGKPDNRIEVIGTPNANFRVMPKFFLKPRFWPKIGRHAGPCPACTGRRWTEFHIQITTRSPDRHHGGETITQRRLQWI